MKNENVQIKPLNKYWVVVYKDGSVDLNSAHYLKNFSIKIFLKSFYSNPSWKDSRKEGYRCIKVNIEFKPTK